MVDTPIASFAKSKLREPEVVRQAALGPVEIVVGGGNGPLLLLPKALVADHAEVQRLSQLFVRMVVELKRPDPSPVVLGEVGYIAGWSPEDRDRFVDQFAEALAASLRTEDPRPARDFITLMGSAGQVVTNRELTGEVTGAARDALADRLGR